MLIHILRCLPQTIQTSLVPLMFTMTEVEPGNIHTRINQLLELVYFPTCWPKGAEDFSPAGTDISSTFDGLKVDVATGEGRDVRCV